MRNSAKYIMLAAVVIVFVRVTPTYPADPTWGGNDFPDIILTNIDSQSAVMEGSKTLTLYTEQDIAIIADHSTAAQLTHDGGTATEDTLITEYKLTLNGDGSGETGGVPPAEYASYEMFLPSPVQITYYTNDNYVDVTLSVRARNRSGNIADSGTYTATQTITVTW